MNFTEFDLDPRCLRVLHEQGLETPTPIQEAAIPFAIQGKDLIATAQTGTGKTLAYVLPCLSHLAKEQNIRNRMLVLVPTRELAVQVDRVVKDFAKATHLHCALIYGGVGMQSQITKLKRGCDIIVATPGRLLDHMGSGHIKFNTLEILVFDEADRMLDMGFLPDIKRIVAKLPQKRHTMMFSATFAPEIQRMSKSFMIDHELIEMGPSAKPVDLVRQLVYPVRTEDKQKVLLDMLKEEKIDSGIIFMRTKVRTDRMGTMLNKAGYKAGVIHGDLNQRQRQRALDGFREGAFDILVATDVAARGLDVDTITHVINYDIPNNPDDYVHRIGRTARAQREGDAFTFVCPSEHAALAAIEKTIGYNIPRKEYEGAPALLSTWRPAGANGTAPGAKGGTSRGGVRRMGHGFGRRRR